MYRAEGRVWHAGTHQYHYFEARATPILDAENSPSEWVGACTGVDKAKRHEIRLESLNQDLKSFTHAASQDLQEPLRTVMIFTELLQRDYQGKVDPAAARCIGHIAEGATRMEALLRGRLAYWTAGEPGEHVVAPLDCGEILGKALANLETAVEEGGAVITHDSLPTVLGEETPCCNCSRT